MKAVTATTILLLAMFTGIWASAEEALLPHDIYLIIYTTKTGRTGHVGFAVDNYRVIIRDTVVGGVNVEVYDTVKTNTVTYFDLWGPPEIGLHEHDKDLPARYFTLPRSSAETPIRLDYFLTRGLPHGYDYPCDALVRIRTSAATDANLRSIAESVQQDKNYFNSRRYNCTDYAITCLNRVFGLDIEAKEFIPFQWSSTPNCLYKTITETLNVEIIREPGDEVNRSFFRERIINSEILNQTNNEYEKTND